MQNDARQSEITLARHFARQEVLLQRKIGRHGWVGGCSKPASLRGRLLGITSEGRAGHRSSKAQLDGQDRVDHKSS